MRQKEGKNSHQLKPPQFSGEQSRLKWLIILKWHSDFRQVDRMKSCLQWNNVKLYRLRCVLWGKYTQTFMFCKPTQLNWWQFAQFSRMDCDARRRWHIFTLICWLACIFFILYHLKIKGSKDSWMSHDDLRLTKISIKHLEIKILGEINTCK